MPKTTAKEGFSIIEAIVIVLVVAVLGLAGWLVWRQGHQPKKTVNSSASQTSKQHSNTQIANPYAGWKTYRLENGLSFKYPADWSTPSGASDPTGIEVNSPASGGYYFTVQLVLGRNTDVNPNFLGVGNIPGTTIAKLDASISGAPLYLVAQNDANSNVTGLGLATTPGNTTTSFGILDNNGHGDKNITMSANLVPVGSGAGINNPYSLQTYQAQANYSTVVNIFKSISE
ncbi:MAG TPA: hypothetical protein VJR27_01460 [Candidatus Saccharimonadales bacterium]|nr:hypothetical protein [Candidatus Saccharimonadales bacterium]